jgi:hypothetical protein
MNDYTLYLYIYVYMHTYIHIRICTFICIHTSTYIYVHSYTYKYRTLLRTQIARIGGGTMISPDGFFELDEVSVYVYICMFRYIYMYIYMYICNYMLHIYEIIIQKRIYLWTFFYTCIFDSPCPLILTP